MTMKSTRVLGIVPLIVLLPVSCLHAQQSSELTKAVAIVGLPGVKANAKGELSVEKGNLHFMSGKKGTDVSARSIEDVVCGMDSQKAVGKPLGTLSMVAPYGGGRVVSLFRKKIDTLTIEYREADGGLHGVIFTMPRGTADHIRKQLIAEGAHTTAATEQAGGEEDSPNPSPKEEKQ